jgi:DNA-binding transcriptional LysR family regulator
MTMNLRDIEYFAVIAEHGHLGRASEALRLGQPALSMSLGRLERAAGAKLVRRTAKGVELTAVGAALLTHVRRLRLAKDDLARELRDLSQGLSGHLRIGAGPQIGEHLLPGGSIQLMKDAPNLTLEIIVSDTDVLAPALLRGELELIAIVTPASAYEGVAHEHLYDDDWVVCASANHRLARLKRVSIRDLAQERWAVSSPDTTSIGYQQWLDDAFVRHGVPGPRAAIQTRSQTLRFQVVSTSGLLCFTSNLALKQAAPRFGLARIAVKELTWRRSLCAAYRKDAYLSPAARRLIEILKAQAREIKKNMR